MDEARSWDILSLLDWDRAGDDDAVLEPAVNSLAAEPVGEIIGFEEILAKKLYDLDEEQYARHIGESSYTGQDESFSADEFPRSCCAVANGKEFYEQVLSDPRQMPKDLEFEALLELAGKAYAKKTGEEFKHITKYNYDSFSNMDKWS